MRKGQLIEAIKERQAGAGAAPQAARPRAPFRTRRRSGSPSSDPAPRPGQREVGLPTTGG
jgi:hypothetical protein